jgi:hypothetical protein
MKPSSLFLIMVALWFNVIALMLDNEFHILIINISIITIYFKLKPKFLLHPNNVVFGFAGLYFVLPSTVYLIYFYAEIPYILPWGQLYKWDELDKLTYVHALFMFIVPFIGFHYFTKNENAVPYREIPFKVKPLQLVTLTLGLFVVIAVYVNLTGGLASWLGNYQLTYLVEKAGYGHINFIILFIGDLVVFLLGLGLINSRSYSFKWFLIYAAGFLMVVIISYIQGLKSRLIFLLLLFYLPYIQYYEIKNRRVVGLAAVFFVLLFIGNYFRSNGFYSGATMFVEYMMSYFNSYPLHDLYIKEEARHIFGTLHQIVVKPLIKLGMVGPNTDYDLSVMLTKRFFPEQWWEYRSTQQWPLITELYINYFGMLFGWIPLLLYVYLLSFIYKKSMSGNMAMMLIYMIEFVRLFSTFRGVLLPWQLPVYVVFYITIYYLAAYSIKRLQVSR